MGPTRFIYVKSMAFDSTSRFLPGSRLVIESVLFIADKMGDLSLHQPESWEIDGSNTDHFPSTPTQAGLACEARLGRGSSGPGEFESDPSGDSVNHHEMSLTLRVVEKSSLWGRVTPPPPPMKPKLRLLKQSKQKSPEWLGWPVRLTRRPGKDTMASIRTQEHWRLKLTMVPPSDGPPQVQPASSDRLRRTLRPL
jgi:hypothetical protein